MLRAALIIALAALAPLRRLLAPRPGFDAGSTVRLAIIAALVLLVAFAEMRLVVPWLLHSRGTSELRTVLPFLQGWDATFAAGALVLTPFAVLGLLAAGLLVLRLVLRR